MEKKRTWKNNLNKLRTLGLMPNHPDSKTKTLTAPMHKLSKKKRVIAFAVACAASAGVGTPSVTKLACTPTTISIATHRSNSMLLSRVIVLDGGNLWIFRSVILQVQNRRFFIFQLKFLLQNRKSTNWLGINDSASLCFCVSVFSVFTCSCS